LVFTLDSAAVSTTKFMIAAAKGMWAAANAVTKGLPESVDEPALRFQGTIVTMIAIANT
jgi:hypothetical protein